MWGVAKYLTCDIYLPIELHSPPLSIIPIGGLVQQLPLGPPSSPFKDASWFTGVLTGGSYSQRIHLTRFIWHCTMYIMALYPTRPLHCTALHCTALHYFSALNCTTMQCTALYCTVLHCTALYCTTLQCAVLHCTTQHFSALHYNALCYIELHSYELQYTTLLHCSTICCPWWPFWPLSKHC